MDPSYLRYQVSAKLLHTYSISQPPQGTKLVLRFCSYLIYILATLRYQISPKLVHISSIYPSYTMVLKSMQTYSICPKYNLHCVDLTNSAPPPISFHVGSLHSCIHLMVSALAWSLAASAFWRGAAEYHLTATIANSQWVYRPPLCSIDNLKTFC